MIVDHIKNAAKYTCLSKAFQTALTYLKNYDPDTPHVKELYLDETVIIRSASYMTKVEEDCVFEAHMKYADIHYIVSGAECIGYAPTDHLTVTATYEADDAILLKGKGTNIPLEAGFFMIVLPDDAHMPGVKCGETEKCTKLIAKVLLD